MIHRYCLPLLLIVAAFQVGCDGIPPDAYLLSVPLRPQEATNWCWAASGEMIMDFLGKDVSQCEQANGLFSSNQAHSDCCESPPLCNFNSQPQFRANNFDFAITLEEPALSWDKVQDQIWRKKKPWAFACTLPGGGTHMKVGIGYESEGGTHSILINDPWPVPNESGPGGDHYKHPYDLSECDELHSPHWRDYYDITKL